MDWNLGYTKILKNKNKKRLPASHFFAFSDDKLMFFSRALHFPDADFIIGKKDQRKSRVVESTKLNHKQLRKDAIPSIWPNCPHYLSSPGILRPYIINNN